MTTDVTDAFSGEIFSQLVNEVVEIILTTPLAALNIKEVVDRVRPRIPGQATSDFFDAFENRVRKFVLESGSPDQDVLESIKTEVISGLRCTQSVMH